VEAVVKTTKAATILVAAFIILLCKIKCHTTLTKNGTWESKTRLAKTIGVQEHLKFIKTLTHTQSIVSPIDADKFVFYSDSINNDDQWSATDYYKTTV
jgi:hypothetical protein